MLDEAKTERCRCCCWRRCCCCHCFKQLHIRQGENSQSKGIADKAYRHDDTQALIFSLSRTRFRSWSRSRFHSQLGSSLKLNKTGAEPTCGESWFRHSASHSYSQPHLSLALSWGQPSPLRWSLLACIFIKGRQNCTPSASQERRLKLTYHIMSFIIILTQTKTKIQPQRLQRFPRL